MNPTDKSKTNSWYALPIERVLIQLQTSQSGLSQQEALLRLKSHKNSSLKKQKKSFFRMFLNQMNNYLIILLIFLVLVSNLS